MSFCSVHTSRERQNAQPLGCPIVILGIVAIVTLLGACQDDLEKRGQIIVSLDTDMALPEEVDEVWIQVAVRGDSRLSNPYPVGPLDTQHKIPGTLTIVAGDDPSTPVTIRVAGKKLSTWRTYREVVTTVPTDRTALLRMPLQWLCDGSAELAAASADTLPGMQMPQSHCDEPGYACKAGTCQPSEVEMASLGTYDPRLVFGGAVLPEDGTCFDTVPCMIGGTIAEPDADCTIAEPDTESFNVALRVPSDGICDASGTSCFVPFNGNHEEGWTTQGDRLQLPGAACKRLAEGTASAVYVSTDCDTKTEADPPCGGWSSVKQTDSDIDPVVAQAEQKLARQVSGLIEPGMPAVPCCPLLHADDVLYTCICPGEKPNTEAELVAARLANPSAPIKVGDLSWPYARDQISFGATVWDGALYFVDQQSIRRARLLNSDATTATIPIDAAIYESTTLLADDDALYMLANSLMDTEDPPVQLLKLGHDDSVTAFATGGNKPVFQFDQDDDAVFVVTDRDERLPGGRIRRRSSVTRIDKQNGQRSTALPETMLTVDDELHGGYIGVQVDAGTLFALFERAPADDGTVGMALFAIDLSEPAPSETPAPLYQVRIDPELTQLSLLGAVDGDALLSRIEYPRQSGVGPAVRSSSVLMLPRSGGAPRIVADFLRDYPMQGLSTDDESIFWLNISGSLFALPRTL